MYNKGFEDVQNGTYNSIYSSHLNPEDKKEYEAGARLAVLLIIAKFVGKLYKYIIFIIYIISINVIYFLPAVLILYVFGFFDVNLSIISEDWETFLLSKLLPAIVIFALVSILTFRSIKIIKGRELGRFFTMRKMSATHYLLTALSLLSSASFALYIIYYSPKGSYVSPWKYLFYFIIISFVVIGSYETQFSSESLKRSLLKSRLYRKAFFRAAARHNTTIINPDTVIDFINDNNNFKKRSIFNYSIVIITILIMGFVVPYFLNQHKIKELRYESSINDKYIHGVYSDSIEIEEFIVSDVKNHSKAPHNKINNLLNYKNDKNSVHFNNIFMNIDWRLSWEERKKITIPIDFKMKGLAEKEYKLLGFYIGNAINANISNNDLENRKLSSIKGINIYINNKLIETKTLSINRKNPIVFIKPNKLKKDDIVRFEITEVYPNYTHSDIIFSALYPVILSETDNQNLFF